MNTDPSSDPRPPRRHAVRAVAFHDRFFRTEEKLYCDRPTEKTVRLTLTDEEGGAVVRSTPKITCQYPIVNLTDHSRVNVDNADLHSPYFVLDPSTDR